MNHSKLLCLNVRPYHVKDFSAIADLIAQQAPQIGVLGRPGDLAQLQLPPALEALPHLNVYLVNPPTHPPVRGCTLTVEWIDKYEQFLSYRKAAVDTPLTDRLAGVEHLPIETWGERVIIKPGKDSFGRGVALVETDMLNRLLQERGAEYQQLLDSGYLVQAFVDTGLYQEKFRVTVFMGEVILCDRVNYRKPKSLPAYKTITEAIEDNYFDATSGVNKHQLMIDQELNEFARRAYNANPQCPLQGLDIQRDKDGKYFVIENNAGGNVWKFSDVNSAPYKLFGPKRMQAQFGAWQVCADALIKATNELAC